MIEMTGLTKRYGPVAAVAGLTCAVRPGRVTGFLGPNGAGKTTTMRMVLGLDHPSAGTVTVTGRRYAELPVPLREVGALLDARAVHRSRTAYQHLRCLAYSNGIARRRVDEVLGLVGLQAVAGRRAGSFSLGMAQRLGIAAALLGDPGVLIFDEPLNGLDTDGIRWVRRLLRGLAAEGRTVLVSSHLMSEMALTADHLIVLGRGRLVADTTTDAFVRASSPRGVRVRVAQEPPGGASLRDRLVADGAAVTPQQDGSLLVSGLDSTAVGAAAAATGAVLAELVTHTASLEEAFLELTEDAVEFSGHAADVAAPGVEVSR